MTPRLRAGELLAVYGLLRPAAGGLDRLRARGRVVIVGPCRLPGRLIDLGGHPGLVDADGEVAGDLLRLRDSGVGDRLDAFEDVLRHDPARSVYRRVRLRLVAPKLSAWAYLWNGPADAGPTILGGDWLAHASGR